MHRRRRKDCRKYEKWKAERASKQTEKGTERRKRRQPMMAGLAEDDELEDVTPPKTVSKAGYRKCSTKGTKRGARETARKCMRKLVRRISYAELVLGCIKPSLEERKHLLDWRHIGCVGLSVDVAPETPTTSQIYVSDRLRGRKIYRRRSESEDSECDSVCSFDSDVCLAGVKLTAKDKEEIKKYQREAPKAV
ncbi:hypothetical protein QLX08_007723 [Tetragonisca angustula]|uniref:Uncharacterized protein n=1 Tax=Tetragonisca angustula TaxID=166442 RepID=A0AAW0ZRB0_9HYME